MIDDFECNPVGTAEKARKWDELQAGNPIMKATAPDYIAVRLAAGQQINAYERSDGRWMVAVGPVTDAQRIANCETEEEAAFVVAALKQSASPQPSYGEDAVERVAEHAYLAFAEGWRATTGALPRDWLSFHEREKDVWRNVARAALSSLANQSEPPKGAGTYADRSNGFEPVVTPSATADAFLAMEAAYKARIEALKAALRKARDFANDGGGFPRGLADEIDALLNSNRGEG